MTCRKCNHDKVKKFGHCGRTRAQRYRCLSCRSTFVVPIEKPLGNHTTDLDTAVRVLELMMEGTSGQGHQQADRLARSHDLGAYGHCWREMPAFDERQAARLASASRPG